MKVCSVCGVEKDLTSYYLNKDGRPCTGRCKPCHKQKVKENRESKADQYRAYEKQRSQLPHRKEAREIYAKGAGKEKADAAKKRYIERNPKKRKVHVIVGNALRDGILVKKPCEVCGDEYVEAHHCDYDKALEVVFLCPKHHQAWHDKNGPGLNGD